MTAAKTHYSALELADLRLPGLPGTERNIRALADRESWQALEVPSRGRTGLRKEYPVATLPAPARQALLERKLAAPTASSSPAATAGVLPATSLTLAGLLMPGGAPCADLTDHQRLERDARAGVVAAIRRFQIEAGCSQEAAMQTLLTTAASGRADPLVVKSLQLARDGRGRKGNGLPSIRTLKRWLSAPDLTPRVAQRDMSIPPWAKAFLERYQQPQKPSIEAAYRDACNAWTAAQRPSIHQVRRFLDKLGTVNPPDDRATCAAMFIPSHREMRPLVLAWV